MYTYYSKNNSLKTKNCKINIYFGLNKSKYFKLLYIKMYLGHDEKEKNLMHIIELLLESFRQYKKMEFKPNKRAMRSLVEMGFDEKNVIGALKITGNDQANAVS